MLKYLIQHIEGGVPYTTDVPGVYRIRKSFVYDSNQLDQFRQSLSQQLDALSIAYQIIASGIHNAPTVPYRGNQHLQHSSHYWIDLRVDPNV